MNINWNRKEKNPEDTVNDIVQILKNNSIETVVTSKTCYKDLWFSCRIEIKGLSEKGTNGKGISDSFAMASCYAELMERLQTRMLYSGLYQKKEEKRNETISKKATKDMFKSILKEYLEKNHFSDDENINKLLLCKNGQYAELKKYFNALDNKVELLPERFLFSLCGSNGLCSGNTKMEAFNQGLCEVFERYVNYKIYHEHKFVCPIVPREQYENLSSFRMIKEIETKGYSVFIKDCTLNGRLPVLGVLVINKTRTKYYFKLGSDINMDICIQRCITEMFQGLDFDTTFRMQMHETNALQYKNFWELSNLEEEYYKTVRTGGGKLPRSIFINPITTNVELKPFLKENLGNDEVGIILVNIVKKLKKKLYIKDYSYLGFPTLSIYVPGMSEIIDYSNGIAETQNTLSILEDAMCGNSEKSREELLNINYNLKKLVSENLISDDYYTKNLLGISLKNEYNGILSKNIYYLIAILSLYLQQNEDAILYLEKYHRYSHMKEK